MADLKVELRRVHYSARLSQETSAFDADVYIDGAKAGSISNDGHGGSSSAHIDPAAFAKLKAFVDARPEYPSPWDATVMLKDGIEDYLDGLFEAWLAEQEVKKFEAKCRRQLSKQPPGFVAIIFTYVDQMAGAFCRNEPEQIADTIAMEQQRASKRGVGTPPTFRVLA